MTKEQKQFKEESKPFSDFQNLIPYFYYLKGNFLLNNFFLEITNKLGIVFFLLVVSAKVPPSSVGVTKICKTTPVLNPKVPHFGH